MSSLHKSKNLHTNVPPSPSTSSAVRTSPNPQRGKEQWREAGEVTSGAHAGQSGIIILRISKSASFRHVEGCQGRCAQEIPCARHPLSGTRAR